MELPAGDSGTELAARDSLPFGGYARYGLPVFIFLIVAVFIGSALDPFTPVKTLILRLFAVGGLLVWCVVCMKRGEIIRTRTPLDAWFAALLIWGAASFIYAYNRIAAYTEWLNLFCGVFLFYMVVMSVRDAAGVRRLLALMTAPVLFVSLLGTLDLFNVDFFPWDALFISNRWYSVFSLMGVSGGAPAAWIHNFDGRASASFGNPVYMAGYLVMLLPPVWVLYTGESRPRVKYYYLAVLLLLEFMLISTFSRTAWVCVILSSALLWLLLRAAGAKSSGGRLAFFFIVALLALSVVLFVVRSKVIEAGLFRVDKRVASVVEGGDESLSQRLMIWKTAREMVRANPVAGVGLGNYIVRHPYYQRKFFESERWAPYTSFPDRVHNEFLDIWAETGIIGLAIFAGVLATLLVIGVGSVRTGGEEGRLVAGLLAGGFALLVYSLTQFPLHVTAVVVHAWLFAGMVVALGADRVCRERRRRLWRPARRGESALLTAVAAVLFVLTVSLFFQPLIGNVVFFWGVRYENAGNSDRVNEMMIRGIVLDPGNLEMSIRYGMTVNSMAAGIEDNEEKKKLYAAVRDESLRGLAMFPFEPRLNENLGVALIRLGAPQKAIDFLLNAVNINPLNPLSNYNMGIAYYYTGDYNNSIYYYEKALEMAPKVPGAYQNLGLAYTRTGLYEKAVDAFEMSLFTGQDDMKTLNSLGTAYSRLGKRKEAISSYRRALAIDPGYNDARGNLAIELITDGDYEAALLELNIVIEKDSDSGMAHYHLGRLYNMMGRRDEAVSELKKAAELLANPNDAISLMKSIIGGN